MEHLFSKCNPVFGPDGKATGAVVMPATEARRWQHQLETRYLDLPDEQRESDRAEADKMLRIIGHKP